MKNFTAILLLFAQTVIAQKLISPQHSNFKHQFLKSEVQNQKWYVYKDTTRILLGEVETTIDPSFQKDKLLVIQRIKLKNAPSVWTDSTIADQLTLAPRYHSSYNAQRQMKLTYSPGNASVWHQTNSNNKTVKLSDTISGGYFDSNLGPHLVRWLPLKPGFKGKFLVYNYGDEENHGTNYVTILSVENTIYNGIKAFEVVAIDEQSKSEMVYTISKAERKMLKSVINVGGKKMEFL